MPSLNLNLDLSVNFEFSGYTCNIRALLQSNIFTCATLLDIDECVEQSPCDGNAVCTNTIGSFTCACNDGYSGNGMTCRGENFTVEDASLWFVC